MQVPINPTVQQQYRDALLVPASPSMIDTDVPIQPVSIIGGANLNATLSAGFLKNSSSQTAFWNYAEITSNTTTTLRTVTASKTAYITDFIVTTGADANGEGGIVEIQVGGVTVTKTNMYNSSNFNNGKLSINLKTPIVASAGTTITVISTAVTDEINVTIVGWEE